MTSSPSDSDRGGIYTVRYRHYDVGLGRWLERDPLEYVDGMSMYQYVRGMPLGAMDPFGLADWWNPVTWWGDGWIGGGGFLDNLADTGLSIIGTYGDVIDGDWGNLPSRYDQGPFGQAESVGGWVETTTKGAIYTSAAAAALAAGLMLLAELGHAALPNAIAAEMEAAIGAEAGGLARLAWIIRNGYAYQLLLSPFRLRILWRLYWEQGATVGGWIGLPIGIGLGYLLAEWLKSVFFGSSNQPSGAHSQPPTVPTTSSPASGNSPASSMQDVGSAQPCPSG